MSEQDKPASTTSPDQAASSDERDAAAQAALDKMSGAAAAKTVNQEAEEDEEEKVNWLAELRGLAIMLLAVLMFHSLVAKPFYIPSTSMMPTLHVGDRLIVSKYPYGWSWASASFHLLPRGEWRVFGATPEYGDVVIPVHPEDNVDYIKRVVALPGDVIEVRAEAEQGVLYINGERVKREDVPNVRIPFEPELTCAPNDRLCLRDYDPYLTPDGQFFEPPTFRETLPNGATYLVVDHLYHPLDSFGPYEVPADHVFVMGDNRDHSADSRERQSREGLDGAIPLYNIGGRAEFITFSLDGSATWNPFSWFSAMRGNRAWSTLRPALAETSTPEPSEATE